MFNVRTSAARTSWHLREHQLGLAASQLHVWCYLIYCCLCMSFSRTRCTCSELGIAAWCKWVEQCETANNNMYQVIHVYVLSNVQTLLHTSTSGPKHLRVSLKKMSSINYFRHLTHTENSPLQWAIFISMWIGAVWIRALTISTVCRDDLTSSEMIRDCPLTHTQTHTSHKTLGLLAQIGSSALQPDRLKEIRISNSPLLSALSAVTVNVAHYARRLAFSRRKKDGGHLHTLHTYHRDAAQTSAFWFQEHQRRCVFSEPCLSRESCWARCCFPAISCSLPVLCINTWVLALKASLKSSGMGAADRSSSITHHLLHPRFSSRCCDAQHLLFLIGPVVGLHENTG